MRAAQAYGHLILDHMNQRADDLNAMVALLQPYAQRLGGNPSVSQIRPLMTPAEQARLDEICDRLATS